MQSEVEAPMVGVETPEVGARVPVVDVEAGRSRNEGAAMGLFQVTFQCRPHPTLIPH